MLVGGASLFAVLRGPPRTGIMGLNVAARRSSESVKGDRVNGTNVAVVKDGIYCGACDGCWPSKS